LVVTRLFRSSHRLTTWTIGGAGVVGEVAQLVEDEEPALAVSSSGAAQAPGRLLAAEVEEELGGGGEEDVMARKHGPVRDVLSDHRSAEALGRDQNEGMGLGEELQP
jgi:hypothetical protein